MNGCRVAIVADDLTGALDAAAPFAARGAQTRVVIAPERLEAALRAWGEAPPEVIAVNTESRHLSAAAAAERVAAVTRRLAPLGPGVWFKKVDSTLRGHVAAEVRAAWAGSRRPAVVIAPAFPAEGRVTVEGIQHVRGVPVHESDYARDPVHPVRCSDLAMLFPEAVLSRPDRAATRDAEFAEYLAARQPKLLRTAYLIPVEGLNQVTGKPFRVSDIAEAALARLEAP